MPSFGAYSCVMARTDNDTWDLATSVGATATMVAAARAAASRRPDPVIDDPFAEPLVRAVGNDFFTLLATGELDFAAADDYTVSGWMPDVFAIRARFYDDYFAAAWRAGIRQVVIVASGLDARAYRLPWPAGTTVYEIDQPEVIEFKNTTLAGLGAAPTASLRTVGIDLRQDWPTALRRSGFDPTQPTAWSAEGLLIGFLPSDAQDRLLDDITALSASGSRFAADHMPSGTEGMQPQMRELAQRWKERGLDIDLADLTYSGDHNDVHAYLRSHGWDAHDSSLADLFAAAGLAAPQFDQLDGPPVSISYVTATRN
jgi:methyltransferase (TIGR00027 family)